MTEDIVVETDPLTAFATFTDEYDQWWGRGPIDAHDTWRLVERRIEGGVGGRVVEDYGDEQLVLGAITTWEPGARLAWTARNDVAIEVSVTIVTPITEHGFRSYTAADCDGRHWVFAQSGPRLGR